MAEFSIQKVGAFPSTGVTDRWYIRKTSTTDVQIRVADGAGNMVPLDYVLPTRQINTGLHLDGGGDLSGNRNLTVLLSVSQYVKDNENNNRLYFGSTTTKYGSIVRASAAGQDHELRDSTNTARWQVEADTGRLKIGDVPWARLSGHRSVVAGTGLNGGGDLSANREISFDVGFGDARYARFGHSHPDYISKTSNDTFTGKLSVGSTSSRNAGLYGIYDSTKIGHIWGMGTAYSISANGTGLGNFYGMAYGHSNSGLTPISGQHQTMFVHSGLVGASIAYHSGQIWTRIHGDSSQWKQAYDWGNHAAAGYPTVSWTEGRYSRVVKNISDLANIGSAESLPLFFYSGYQPLNRPSNGHNYYSGIQFKHGLSEDYRTMLAVDTGGAEPNLFIRTKINGIWHSGGWKRFWHNGDVAQPVNSVNGAKNTWTGTQAAFDAIATKDPSTIYFIT